VADRVTFRHPHRPLARLSGGASRRPPPGPPCHRRGYRPGNRSRPPGLASGPSGTAAR
jgi:hypothetical protein